MASDEIIGFINVNWQACIDTPGNFLWEKLKAKKFL